VFVTFHNSFSEYQDIPSERHAHLHSSQCSLDRLTCP
jgi:hypothetical protein